MQTTGDITANFQGCAFDCMPGTYGTDTDLTAPDQCTACPDGTTSPAGSSNKAACVCPLGRYWKTADECALCPAGTASETADATACVCPVQRYWATADDCAVCPEGRSSYAPDATVCICPAGTFDALTTGTNAVAPCVECPP